jgi:hypothetical protein
VSAAITHQQAHRKMRPSEWNKFAILPLFSGLLVHSAKKANLYGKKNRFDGYDRQEDSGGPAKGRQIVARGDRIPSRVIAFTVPAQNSAAGKSRRY